MIRIDHVRNRKRVTGHAVYVGRANRFLGVGASPLANPFHVLHEEDRAAVVLRYRDWLLERVSSQDAAVCAELERLAALARNGDLTLLCWCAPKACHADVIKETLEGMLIAADRQ